MTKVKEYINKFPQDVRVVLEKIRLVIKREIPNADEAISYGIPTFKINGKYIIYFAGWKKHVSIYPIPTGDESFQKEIAPFVAGAGTLKFMLDKEIPYELIEKITKFAVKVKSE